MERHYLPKATYYFGDMSMPDDDGDLLCGYASKKCSNVRTTKKGGGLHRFCEFHRCRANRNQWRVDNKRRAVRAERRQQLKRLALSATAGVKVETLSLEPLKGGPPPSLTTEDLELLQAMLLDDHNDHHSNQGFVPELDTKVSMARLDCTSVEFIF